MLHVRIISTLILFCSCAAFAQPAIEREKKAKYVRIPSEKVAILTAMQLDCPLRLEQAEYLVSSDGSGKWAIKYKIRNISSKPIRLFTITAWSSEGGWGTLDNPLFSSKKMLMPGETLESIREGVDYDLVPMTSQVQDKFSAGKGMQSFWALIVDQVTFADGSSYKATALSDALWNYLRDQPR